MYASHDTCVVENKWPEGLRVQSENIYDLVERISLVVGRILSRTLKLSLSLAFYVELLCV